MRLFFRQTALLSLTASTVALLSACSDNALFSEKPSPEITGVTITAASFIPEQSLTRTAVDINELGADFIWQESDIVGIYPDEGTQVRFPMENGAGSSTAKFDGGGWAVKGAYSYMAYYPFIPDMNMDKRAIPADYRGQRQHGSNNHDHIGRYDYMTAVKETPSTTGTVGFNFLHMGALLKIDLEVPKPGTYTSLTLQTDGFFTIKGTFDITQNPIAIEPTDFSHEFTIDLENIYTTRSGEMITIFLIIPPADLSGWDTYAILRNDNVEFKYELQRKNYEAGKIYAPAAGSAQGSEVTRLIPGGEFSSKLKTLANDYQYFNTSTDYEIKNVIFKPNSDYKPVEGDKHVDVADPSSIDHIYAVWNASTRTMTIHSDKDIIRCNENTMEMFFGFEGLESIDFTGFSTSDTKDFHSMFQNCVKLKSIDLTNFDFNNATGLPETFSGCKSLTSINFTDHNNIGNIEDLFETFHNCSSLTSIDLTVFTAEKLRIPGVVGGCSSLEDINLGSLAFKEECGGAFGLCSSLKTIDLSNCDFSDVTSIVSLFSGCESLEEIKFGPKFTTQKATDLTAIFENCKKLKSIDLSYFDTSNATTFQAMFGGCNSLESLDLSMFDTRNVTQMDGMFSDCHALKEVDLSSFNTEKLENMNSMFNGCSSLETVDLSNFCSTNVRYMDYMFYGANNLKSIDLSSFEVPYLQTIKAAFQGCSKLETVTFGENFKTVGCEDFSEIFAGCESLKTIDLSMFDTRRAKNFFMLFSGCTSLVSLDLKNFETKHVGNMDRMFECESLKFLDISNFEVNEDGDLEVQQWAPYNLEEINYGSKWNYDGFLIAPNNGECLKKITCLPAFMDKLIEVNPDLLTYKENGTLTFINAETGEEM